ncbi:MAG: hypothetical protein HWN67_13125 [Candidatus Helarchaeota archaeon]|nr:hypothetical protein [Candidatus Helarchaeota archaeon]
MFYFIPYSRPDLHGLVGENYFSIFKRFGRTLCYWDILIFSLATLLLIKKLLRKKLTFVGIQYKEVNLYIFLMIFALINGFLHVSGSYLSFGPTEFLRPIIVFMPFFYFISMYLLTVNVIESKLDLERIFNFIWVLTILLIIYSIYRFLGILSGRIETMMMFGLPMILYDQMSFLYYPIFLYTSLNLLKVRSKKKNFFVAFSLFLIILTSTRRFNYLILILGFFITIFLVYKVRDINLGLLLKKFSKVITFLLVIFLVIIIVLPDFSVGVFDSIRSIYFISEFGLSHGGMIRKTELQNMFLNMNKRVYSYFVGYGLGTRWEEIIDVPFDSMSHDKKEMERSINWWPGFHLPYISKLYIFGIVGTLFFLVIMLIFLKRSLNFIRLLRGDRYYQAQMIAITSYLLLLMFEAGNSFNPTDLIFCGLLYGLQISIVKYC